MPDRSSISKAMRSRDIEPEYLITHLENLLKQERAILEAKEGVMSKTEVLKAELELTHLENLLLTLMIERER